MAEPLTDSPRSSPWFRPLALIVAACITIPATLIPFIPPEYRPWHFAAFGAVALFTAARGGRIGLFAGLLLALGSKFTFDMMNYAQHGHESMYLPSRVVYASLASYAVLGWLLLRHTRNPLTIGAVAFLGSWQFFLVTNYFAWVGQALPYHRNLSGLWESYTMALPFWRGTLISDMAFTALLFGLNAALGRVSVPASRLAPIPADETHGS